MDKGKRKNNHLFYWIGIPILSIIGLLILSFLALFLYHFFTDSFTPTSQIVTQQLTSTVYDMNDVENIYAIINNKTNIDDYEIDNYLATAYKKGDLLIFTPYMDTLDKLSRGNFNQLDKQGKSKDFIISSLNFDGFAIHVGLPTKYAYVEKDTPECPTCNEFYYIIDGKEYKSNLNDVPITLKIDNQIISANWTSISSSNVRESEWDEFSKEEYPNYTGMFIYFGQIYTQAYNQTVNISINLEEKKYNFVLDLSKYK